MRPTYHPPRWLRKEGCFEILELVTPAGALVAVSFSLQGHAHPLVRRPHALLLLAFERRPCGVVVVSFAYMLYWCGRCGCGSVGAGCLLGRLSIGAADSALRSTIFSHAKTSQGLARLCKESGRSQWPDAVGDTARLRRPF